tara:strand:- start:22 stop:2271 length:2250 start_codon:yes stop_codon:yes gene_type:complete
MLTKIKFAPGIDKQDTAVGAEGRWVDSDNVRFRYGLPEKVGGWQSLLTDSIVGVARKQHAFVDNKGNRYVAIGTDKFLLIYFEGQLFDITPFRCNNAGVIDALTSSTLATNSTTAKTCTITTTTDHDLSVGDIVELSSVTLPSGTGLNGTDFEDKLFQVLSVPTPTTFTIDSLNQATAVISTGGTMTVKVYETVGPAAQTYGYGYGVGNYGGNITGALQNDLDGALAADAAGNNGSGTQIRLTSTTGFPTTGTIAVGNELITYTNIAGNELTGISRGALGTATTGTINGQAHSDGAVVTNATEFTGWGSAVEASTVTLEPGLWSLSNFGQVLVSTIANGKTFTWDSSIAARLSTHASMTTSGFETRIDAATDSGNPTATRVTLISPTTRHLIHLGTETTIGDTTTQDDMFIRFSEDEGINKYTPQATNTAGTQRLQDGTRIMGGLVAKENILIWTDNALYTMKFVGAPFTFGFEQVGTNCGLIGKNAAIEIDGVAYWMGNNGFFSFDGTVNTLPCSVEDFVYDNADTTKGQQVNAGINNLFTEVVWWYPTQGSEFNNRYVVYNYGQNNAQLPMGNWYTGTNTNSIRTTWIDSLVYPRPYATAYNSANTGTFPVVIGESGLGQTVFFEHETGNDQVNPNGSVTALTSFIQSFSFSLQPDQAEVFLAMRRFLPNFKVLVGNNQVTLSIKDFPSEDDVQTTLSPFTINSNTLKVDTRARGRYANIKIENTGVNESWRFGTFQVDIQPDGRRG